MSAAVRPFYTDIGVSDYGLQQLAQAQPFRDYLYVSPLGTRLFQCTLSPVERLLCAASRLEELAVLDTMAEKIPAHELPAAWLRQWGYDEEAALLIATRRRRPRMKTLITILMSLRCGVGSTLLVQTVIVTPPPVVAVVACPEERTVVEQAMIDKALEPLPVEDYVPQGRVAPPAGLSGRQY